MTCTDPRALRTSLTGLAVAFLLGTGTTLGACAKTPGYTSETSEGTTTTEGTTAGSTTTTAGPTTTTGPNTTDPSTTTTTSTTTDPTTDPSTTTSTTTDPSTTGTTTSDSDTSTGTDTEGELMECLSGAIMEKEGENVMEYYGAPCMTDDDCKPLIGPDAICILDLLELYDVPMGACTRPCEQPDDNATETPNFPGCFGGGGASCIGVNGIFTACLFPCEDNSNCHREGYVCREIPVIGSELKYCLVPDACCLEPDPQDCML